MKRIFFYILAFIGTSIFMIPLVWTVSTAQKTRQQIFASPPPLIPIAYRPPDLAGTMQPVTVITRIIDPAAEVKLLSGPQAGNNIAVEQSALSRQFDQYFVHLRAPQPVACEIIQEFPGGL